MPRRRNKLLRNGSSSEGQRKARWCFTINFEGREVESILREDKLPAIEAPIRYRIYQLETGETGTLHYQGYLELERQLNSRELHELPGMSRASTFYAKGTCEQNQRYCSKEDGRKAGPFEEGSPRNQQGKRNDIVQLKDAIDRGEDDRSLFEIHFASATRYIRGLQYYRQCRVDQRTTPPRVFVYWGEPGSGKSKRAHAIVRGRGWSYYSKSNGTGKWWDGYYGQSAVILDEFDPTEFPYRYFLQLLDRYPFKVQVKGSMVEFNSERIFVTTNTHPKDWYPNESYGPLERRIEKIIRFKAPSEEERHKPHECDNSEDSADEGERVEAIASDRREGAINGLLDADESVDATPCLYEEIPEEIRVEIRAGKKEARTNEGVSRADSIVIE